ncbi:hypothetical protein [Streptomyces sp. NPDC005859]|uniref:hypothetical protein n=1 Tax=Streptomyces sp. NPDC005859 TaxID=3157170 RepID=UPI0033F68764
MGCGGAQVRDARDLVPILGGDLTAIEFAALLGREVDGFVPPPAFAQTPTA